MPYPASSGAYDRYAYVNNNPINFNDPSGHSPQIFNTFGEFLTGFGYEFVRTNNWIGAIFSPEVAQSLAPSTAESSAMLTGRIVGDVVTVAIGLGGIVGGSSIAGGGAIVGCGATACLANVPAEAAGAAVVSVGVVTTASGSIALGENLGIAFSRRQQNNLQPDPNATGPHSVAKRDPKTGRVTNYETYRPQSNPQNPNLWEKILRYDGVGGAHFDKNTGQYLLPHIHDFLSKLIRKPFWSEIPK